MKLMGPQSVVVTVGKKIKRICLRLNFLALIVSGRCGENQALLLSSPTKPYSKTWWWEYHVVGVFFSCRDRTGCN